jgi:hypothetical protein
MTKIHLTWSSPPQVSFSASSAVCRINRAKEPALKMNKGDSFFLAARHFDDGFCHLQNVASVWFEEREGGGGKEIWHDSNFFLTRFVPLGWSSSSTSSHLLGLLTILVSLYLSSSSSSRARGRGKGEESCENGEGFYFILWKFSLRKIRILC